MAISNVYNEKLTNIELKKDEQSGEYYLDVTYEYEDDRGCYEMHLPHVQLPFYEKVMPRVNNKLGLDYAAEVSFFENVLQLAKGKTKHADGNYLYTIKTLKEKRQEMTLEEVEKKLGYKIKLVTKKEEE